MIKTLTTAVALTIAATTTAQAATVMSTSFEASSGKQMQQLGPKYFQGTCDLVVLGMQEIMEQRTQVPHFLEFFGTQDNVDFWVLRDGLGLLEHLIACTDD